MTLTPKAQQTYQFTKSCYLQGMCTTKEYLKAVKKIYTDDLAEQLSFFIDKGFSRQGAFKHIYNLDKEEII